MKRRVTVRASGWLSLALLLAAAPTASGQAATAIPKLDPDRFTAPWYQIARSPIKKEKRCLSDEVVLYALGDKKNSFQRVTSCKIKGDISESWNSTGKLDKAGSGKLKINTIWPFTSPYWVLATGPAYEWMLVGTPNHKTVWILSKTPTLSPELFAEAQTKAAAGGFNTSKLIRITQHAQ